MTKTLPLTEVKAHLPELVAGVAERSDEVVVTKNGRPAAMLVNIADYEQLRETLDILSNPRAMRALRKSGKYFAQGGRGLTIEEVFGE